MAKINCKKMSDRQLIDLLKIRMRNRGNREFTEITLEKDGIMEEGFTAIVEHKRWRANREGMTISKLFLNEIEYLLTEGILHYSYIQPNNECPGGKSIIEIDEEYRR